MPVLLATDPICFARDENNDLIIPLRKATGLEAVLILVRTELLLWRDEWFLDRDAGTPWLETEDGVVTERDAILGQGYDPGKTMRALRPRILSRPGVIDVAEFKSSFDGESRGLSISFIVRTRFGEAPVSLSIAA